MVLQAPIDYASRLVSPTDITDAYLDRKVEREQQDRAQSLADQTIASNQATQARTEGLTEQEQLATQDTKLQNSIQDGMVFAGAVANAPNLESQNRMLAQKRATIDGSTPEGQSALAKLAELESLGYEETQTYANNMGQSLYGEAVNRGYITPASPTKTTTRSETVMRNGKPTRILIDATTGAELKEIGEAKPSAKGATVNVGAGETAFEKKSGTLAATDISERRDSIKANKKSLTQISQAEKLLKKEGIDSYQGILGGIKGTVADVANAFGIETEDRDASEQLDGILTSLAIAGRIPGSGPDTDKDFENRKNALGSMENNPTALKGKLKLTRSRLQYQNRYDAAYNKVLGDNKGNYSKTDEAMLKWVEKNPETIPSWESLGLEAPANDDSDVIDYSDLK